jgi:hypothetical protein
MELATHPMTSRLSPDSALALMSWLISYAQANPNTITPQTLTRLANGDQYDRKARALLLIYGLGRS